MKKRQNYSLNVKHFSQPSLDPWPNAFQPHHLINIALFLSHIVVRQEFENKANFYEGLILGLSQFFSQWFKILLTPPKVTIIWLSFTKGRSKSTKHKVDFVYNDVPWIFALFIPIQCFSWQMDKSLNFFIGYENL